MRMIKYHTEGEVEQTVEMVEEREQGRRETAERNEGEDQTWGE